MESEITFRKDISGQTVKRRFHIWPDLKGKEDGYETIIQDFAGFYLLLVDDGWKVEAENNKPSTNIKKKIPVFKPARSKRDEYRHEWMQYAFRDA